ncbi:MAG: hypothetical protein KIT58_14835, partial [Planctomycetota bacterium]|nr:hypothetical protein [Planctomycetota bacterium]
MPRIRQVDDVSIVDWSPEHAVMGELRALVEAGSARRVLLNMAACDAVRADDLEGLTEALTVCDDRGCQVGMFGVREALARVVEVMDLADDLPPVLGASEQEALAALRGVAGGNGKAPAAAARVQEPIIDLDLDAAHAPTARFDPRMGAAPAGATPAGGDGPQP